jgi:L-aminoadipate-semialdehyde dehydrogenase
MESSIVLPDPTIDLHWDDFQGPIHAFFDANTEKHPDRICVVGMVFFKTSNN